MRRLPLALLVTVALLAVPSPAFAHGLVGRLESPLPLAIYLAGAAMAVALSFAFVILRDVRVTADLPVRTIRVPRPVVLGLRAVGLVAWLWIVAQMIVGGSSDADVGGLFLWVYGWVGLAAVSAFIGPVWTWLDPFTTLFDLGAAILRRLGLEGWEPAPYPAWLGAWPAAAGLAFFVWLELVFRGGGLGVVLVGYTVLSLVAMANFGRDAWRAQGETFSVWFGLLNRLAPFGAPGGPDERTVPRRPFAAGLLEPGWSTARVVIVAIGVASILYDGLSQTQVWFDLFGLPSLPLATVQLVAFLGVIIGLALAVGRLVGIAAVGAGLVPIAVGYLVAHYLTYLLGDGQRIVVAISDPFQLGWDLFGTAFYEPGTDWLPPALLWSVMLVSVVGGHVLGAWSGHVVAVRDTPSRLNVRRQQLPLAALMIGLTATTLWSLGQTIVKEPAQGSVATPASVAAPVEVAHGVTRDPPSPETPVGEIRYDD
ncbi:MAG: hypothetical protein M0Z49_09680 [Chloroflexi bacterium]|nr:hypothetical protein [Chloroflexota bacterium]